MTPATAVLATRRGTELNFVTVLSAGASKPPSVRAVPVEAADRVVLDISTDDIAERILITPSAISFPAV